MHINMVGSCFKIYDSYLHRSRVKMQENKLIIVLTLINVKFYCAVALAIASSLNDELQNIV